MILYYGMTNYHILSILVHKILFKKDQKTNLYVSEVLINNQPELLVQLEKSNFFENVKIFREAVWPTEPITKKEEKQIINKIVSDTEKQIGNEIKKYKEIYVCGDQDAFGLYLINNRIKYSYFEEACGVLADHEILFKCIRKQNSIKYKIIKEFPVCGESKYVINRYGYLKSNQVNSKDKNFYVKELLKKLSTKDIKRILTIFDVKKISSTTKEYDLLLTWSYYNMGYMSLENQKKLFTLLVDYFHHEENRLVIKPHPSDVQNEYREWFHDAVILNGHMPSELLPYCCDKKFKNGITNWSTSVFSLGDILENIVNFDVRIDETFYEIDSYYFVVRFLDDTKTSKKKSVILYNINDILLNRMLNRYFPKYEKYYTISVVEKCDYKGDDLYIVHDEDQKINKDAKVININSLSDHRCTKRIILINSNQNHHFIGLYNLKKDVKIKYEKKLKYSSDKVSISEISQDDYIYHVILDRKELSIENHSIKCENENYQRKSFDNTKLLIDNVQLLEDNKKLLNDNNVLYCELQKNTEEINKITNSKGWKFLEKIRKLSKLLRK